MPTTDHRLLSDFTTSKSEASLRSLVDRHAANVLAVALRKTGSPPLAGEITQNVFAVLARKARTLTRKTAPHTSLAGWLHSPQSHAARPES